MTVTAGLAALMRDSVARHLDLPAMEADGHALTYRQLWQGASRLAALVRSSAAGPVRRVALHARRDPVTYLGYVAALHLGAAVVPLGPDFPLSRNAKVITGAGADVVVGSQADAVAELARRTGSAAVPVTAAELLSLLSPGGRGTTNGADGTDGTGAADADMSTGVPAEAPPPGVLPPTGLPPTSPDDVAYVLYTSGSTGRPKGVPIRHRNVCGYVEYHAALRGAGPGSRFSQTFDLTFDPSVFDMFVAWRSGATVVVPSREELHDPVDFVTRRGITHWFSVPSVITLAKRMRRLPAGSMPDLRWSLFAGEQLTWDQADAWLRAAPGTTVQNLYGPTELTITCTCYQVPDDPADRPVTRNGTVPIGQVHPGLDHVLVGRDGRLADEGELCVRGPQRFGGYADPADNTGRFVQVADGRAQDVATGPEVPGDLYYRTGDLVERHPSGVLVHRGRLDNQVKLHGYRVELGEIEAALRTHPRVEDAVVVVPPGSAEPVAFHTGEPVAPHELVTHLQAGLAWYMVPSRYRQLDRLPLNANGKVDRRALSTLGAAPGPGPGGATRACGSADSAGT